MCTPYKDSPWTRYITMGVDASGHLHQILARRGHEPDDIVEKTLEINARNRRPGFEKFERLYVLEVGQEGQYGGSTNLKLREIVSPPPPPPDWVLIHAKGLGDR